MAPPPSKPWAPNEEPAEVVLINANLVHPETSEISENVSLHVKAGRVTTSHDVSQDSSTMVIDLKGKYICPGLIDCHVHLTAAPGSDSVRDLYAAHPDTIAYRTAWNAKQMLLRGFTTVRDTGGATYALRDAIAENLIAGPRVFIAGKALSQTGGHGDLRAPYEDAAFKCCGHGPGLSRVCDGVPACLEAARDELRQGADFLKIMVGGGVASPVDPIEMLQFTGKEIQAITTSARHLGKIVTAHAYTSEAIRHAVDNGVKSIEHANFIDTDTAEMCAKQGVSITPTLVVYKALINPPYENFLPESGRRKCQQVIDKGAESLKILQDAGVNICYGTDLLTGMHVQQNDEFAIRVQVLPSKEVLKHATTNAAKLLRMEGKIGTLTDGAYADLLVLDRNPLEDVGVLAKLDMHCFAIMKEGRVVMSRIDGWSRDTIYS